MSRNLQENQQPYCLPKDDNEIFESMHQDDSKDIVPAVYKVLDKIQLPYRAQLIAFLEDIDAKYGQYISDEEIDKIDALLFDDKGQENFITAKGFNDIAKFVKKQEHKLNAQDIADFDALNAAYRLKVKIFLNTTIDSNKETPLIHACVWGVVEAAEVLKQEGADMPDNILKKAIGWSGIETVNWALRNGAKITPQDIILAKEYRKVDIADKLEGIYKKEHPDYEGGFETPKPFDFKERTSCGTSRIGKSRLTPPPHLRDGR